MTDMTITSLAGTKIFFKNSAHREKRANLKIFETRITNQLPSPDTPINGK